VNLEPPVTPTLSAFVVLLERPRSSVMEGLQMKAGISRGARVAAWSASSLLLVGAAAGTASAATHHAKNTGKDTSTGTGTTEAPSAHPQMLHGSMTVENSDGTFETYVNQMGTVSAVSATSITVVSADSYSATYSIESDTTIVKNGSKATAGDIAKGDTVGVQAEQDGTDLTAEHIFDGKPPAGGRPGPGGPMGGGPAGPPPGAPNAPGGEGGSGYGS
jgi:hypothetical protein